MGHVTLRGMAAHKLRLVLTSLAIVLGVAFISGTFVLTDTLHNTFNNLVGSIYTKIDYQVRGVAQFPSQSASSAVRNPVPESLVATLKRVPGVEAADGSVSEFYAQFLSPSGQPISTASEPTIGENWIADPRISDLRLVQGSAPASNGQVVMDAGTAQKYHFRVGQSVRVLFEGGTVAPFTISGIAEYGTANNLAGITFAAFTLPVAQEAAGEPGKFDHIDVEADPGANKATVQAAIAHVLPPGIEVVTGKTVANETTNSINDALSSFSTFLLIFALIALFVGAFTIFNTFSITVGQRTRELALLRAIGASRRQVFRSVIAEAALTGAISSLIGTGLGVLAAIGLEALMSGLGYTLPSGPLVFEARTVIVALAVGIGVTVVSAVSPARRAVRVAPVAAITEREEPEKVSHRRWFGLFFASRIGGIALIAAGLALGSALLVGVGAAAFFVGLAMLLPSIARPLSSVIGRPLAGILGEPGKLGRANSMRNPARTAQTASALMVGVALVSAMAVFGSSISTTATASVDQAVRADLIVTGKSNGNGTFSRALAAQLSHLPGVTASLTYYSGQFEVDHSLEQLGGVSTQGLSETVDVRMVAGSISALAAGELLVDKSTAKSDHLSVGSSLPVKFALTGTERVRVGGIFRSNAVIGKYLAGEAFFVSHFSDPVPGGVLLKTDGSAAATSKVQAEVGRVLAAYPTVEVQTRAQYEKAQVSSVNQLLTLVYALLALAVLIALIGVVNTLMLSVFERTREIGLLRAVGMKRRQVRTMVRSESVILAVFGAVVGIVVGTAMGVALVASLGLSNIGVPTGELVVFLVLSALLGVVAATWPARRAARLDVLAAIASE
ncbi:MAG TPA: FtsX-like permease family protein [Acidimicrobiales bacterium]|nr:FtsX-like permease family protein [Acidimicrobiales bacterium]